jgi:hypothetical protein
MAAKTQNVTCVLAAIPTTNGHKITFWTDSLQELKLLGANATIVASSGERFVPTHTLEFTDANWNPVSFRAIPI